MAIFQNNPEEWQRLDYRILQNGWSSLYWQQRVLEADLSWFKDQNFDIVLFDCTNWKDVDNIHNDFKTKLNFPDYYGENLDALNDCLSDIEINDNGIIIVLHHFQIVDKKIARALLDIFANNSRQHMLFGKKFITLAQVDNPYYQIEAVGCCPVSWNSAEWLNSKRGL